MKRLLRNVSARRFNQQYPIGSRFNYYPLPGVPDSQDVVTRSEAWCMFNGNVVVRVVGRMGGVSVNKLEPKE
ncbi:hypothetical protein [Martelella alba]|uniref:Uncharacterized protein n=1 Tax=Martelella alba TaxID=2590451 RepID=A0ABY2SR27_9HYPH|nr:hypothetical protein [Martelella alba]TKI08641.1 hypothetical protein FCN80_00890 [Martelella alba]